MFFGWGLRLAQTGPYYGGAGFAPLRFFALGEQGAWYDPSDLSTLFQDSAGTTPVTAHGQPVGLMLDKSGNGNHASQPTAASRPLFQDVGGLRYLAFDGVDDWLSTASIDFTGTDKVSVFAGLRKLSDAGISIVAELGVIANGSITLHAPRNTGVGNYSSLSRGTLPSDAITAGTFAAPNSAIATAIGDIPADVSVLRINGVQAASSSADQGTGNYGNHPLYIGRRGGTTLPFNGNLYGLIIRGALTDDPTTGKVEKFLAGKTGVQF